MNPNIGIPKITSHRLILFILLCHSRDSNYYYCQYCNFRANPELMELGIPLQRPRKFWLASVRTAWSMMDTVSMLWKYFGPQAIQKSPCHEWIWLRIFQNWLMFRKELEKWTGNMLYCSGGGGIDTTPLVSTSIVHPSKSHASVYQC